MLEWVHVAAAVVASAGVLVIILWIFRRITDHHKDSTDNQKNKSGITSQTGTPNLNYQKSPYRHPFMNYYIFPRKEPVFSWADNPSLITEAVENGWSRFAFSSPVWSSPVIRAAALLGPCMAAGNLDVNRVELEMESSWEICQGSADFLQKLRINPGLKKQNTGHCSIAKAALPLPGPLLGNHSSFPQEAYFEITIMLSEEDHENFVNDEEVEEMKESCSSPNGKTECNNGRKKMEEMKLYGKDGGEMEKILLSIGLTTGGSSSSSSVVPWKVPGVYNSGSIGFVSDGSVWLRGEKTFPGSENTSWAKTEKVIGCGYNPIQKKVFFTIDSESVHIIECKTDEFGAPLYPTIWANGGEVTVLINFGQSPFRYAPANIHRTPNPCFIGPNVKKSSSVGYEDSKELFSMGRIDPQWLNRSGVKSGPKRLGEFDEESEGDLFEIRLEKCSGRSPIINVAIN
ncbi:uncharacterized protein LOC124940578 [Impatiens glandulifera]|uniref:uncharacterized protein LOC124940578 n=1 Tax=Impatiens glandulifera TaxID=253017 RepID=UPI001FB069B7|nr:uncharacterized protein LOC124940578 [Impatiens glandulifera]